MALARVVSFEGVGSDRIGQLRSEMESGEAPEGMPPAEFLMLYDGDAERALAIVIFDNEADYQKGHEVLDAMPGPETPGSRTSVTKYDVAIRMSS